MFIRGIVEENWDAFIAENIQGWYNKTNCVKPWEGMSMSNDKITEVGINIREKATVIWNIANALFGD